MISFKIVSNDSEDGVTDITLDPNIVQMILKNIGGKANVVMGGLNVTVVDESYEDVVRKISEGKLADAVRLEMKVEEAKKLNNLLGDKNAK